MDENLYNVVIYTDGSYKPGNDGGHRGAGAHGYIYKQGESIDKPQTDLPNGWVTTTEGYKYAERTKEKRTLVKPVGYMDCAYSLTNIGTSQTAELEAILYTLTYLYTIPYNIDEVLLLSDSEYCKLTIEKLQVGTKNEFSTNIVVIEDIANALKGFPKLTIRHVQGHNGDLGNENADSLALAGRIRAGLGIVDKKHNLTKDTYWKIGDNRTGRHPMLKFKSLFFTSSLPAKGDEIFYSIMEYKKNIEVGKRTNEACLGLVKLQEQPAIVRDLIHSYLKALRERNYAFSVYTVDLSVLYSLYTWRWWEMFGQDSFVVPRDQKVYNLRREQVGRPIVPSGLAAQAIQKSIALYNIYIDMEKKQIFEYFNVTDKFYKDKKFLLKDKDNIKIKLDKTKTVDIEFGTDTLPKSSLKQLEKNFPEVWVVVVKESFEILNYFTIVKANDSLGIFHNPQTSKVIKS